jgi:hypothetical protein
LDYVKLVAELRTRLTRHGQQTAINHLQQAEKALERQDWEAANGQVRSFIEALFNDVARIRLGISATGGDARRKLQASGLLEERAAKVIQSYTDLAGSRGSHAGMSSVDEGNGNLLMGLGVAFLGLALLPELVRVEEVFALNLTDPPGGRLPTDKDIETSCPSCRQTQRLAEAQIQRRNDDTLYLCKNGCQPIVVVGTPGASPWPGRGYRMGDHVLRNASDLYMVLDNGNRVLFPASSAALMARPPAP